MFNVILACDESSGIGVNNTIPWIVAEDVELFKSLTSNMNGIVKVVIMGYNTMKSLKNGYLKNRINIVVTSKIIQHENVTFVSNLHEALCCAYSHVGKDPSRVWIIGGAMLYHEAMLHKDINMIYHSIIPGDYKCDVNFHLPPHTIISSNQMKTFKLNIVKLKENCETKYLNLLHETLYSGHRRITRNGTTISLFGRELVFDASNSFPLLTTKKMFLKGIVEELLFFIRGETDTNKLMDNGVNIWKANTSREFLDKMNLPYVDGMMGPMYGYQWRFFNKPYNSAETDSHYVDQLKNLVTTLKQDPHSRRLLMTDFNPAMVNQGVLYPCHSIILQFYVNDNKLSVKMYQRSADLLLGLPFNIASTTLLLYIIAKLVSMEPNMVHVTLGDCHIYEQHIDMVKEQLGRTPYQLPQLILPEFTTIEQVEQTDHTMYVLKDYICHPAIKAQMIA